MSFLGRLFHGTSQDSAESIEATGLNEGSYLSSDFEIAANYALRHRDKAAVVVVEDAGSAVAEPDEPAYWGGVEFVSKDKLGSSEVLVPKFSEVPADYYELNDDLSGSKYPEIFDPQNWKVA